MLSPQRTPRYDVVDDNLAGALLTSEQLAICSAAVDMLNAPRGMLKISAGAACGKTTSLTAIARRLNELDGVPALYLTFSSALREHTRLRFGANTDVSTLHSMALRWAKPYMGPRTAGSLSAKDVVRLLDLNNRTVPFTSVRAYAGVVLQTLQSFATSPENRISERHLSKGIASSACADDVMRDAAALFDLVRPGSSSRSRVPHDIYLKEWVLQGAPGISAFPIVLFDEGQDANGAMLSALSYAQRVVMVGDENQQLYSFRGALGLLERIPAPQLPLSMSFRFGPELAEVANRILACKRSQSGPKLTGMPSKFTAVGPLEKRNAAHTRIFRTSYELARDALTLADTGSRFTLAGSWQDLSNKLLSANSLRIRQTDGVLHPAIAPFASWRDLVDAANERRDTDLLELISLVSELRTRTVELAGLLSDANRVDIAPIHLTTPHRAKGLEWRNVVVRSDFDAARARVSGRGISTADHDVEQNLLYVAATRASEAVEFHCSTEAITGAGR